MSASALQQLDGDAANELDAFEREAREMLRRFAAGLLHELNSPLGALISGCDTILRAFERSALSGSEDHRAGPTAAARNMRREVDVSRDVANVVQRSRDRIREITADLQRFTQLDQADAGTADVRDEIDRSLVVLARESGGRLEVSRKYPPTPLVTASHPSRLSHALYHLLRHTAACTQEGGSLQVSAEMRGPNVRITVQRDKEMLETGLQPGTQVARRTIESLGGDLNVESRGRRFVIELPGAVVPK